KMTISFINREFVENNNFTDLEISGGAAVFISQFSRVIKGVSWGMVLKPQSNGEVSVSLRSNPASINVAQMMTDYEIGGGHERAAGGTIKEEGKVFDSKEALEKIIKWMETSKPTLS
ncbi:MAG: DHHA1 domain-containing protein, partial [Candidatus Daviesbacteria bacterium]|nr:DHHA1 domain-containing protein [Candidatus Daviesbacteria bacterium]